MTRGKTKLKSSDTGDKSYWTYDRFVEGSSIGSTLKELDSNMIHRWNFIYDSGPVFDQMPRGLAQVIIMSAYTEVVQPRPPGNLHLGQHVEVYSTPKVGDQMSCKVFCIGKHKKKEKYLVTFQVDVGLASKCVALFKGRLTILWAR